MNASTPPPTPARSSLRITDTARLADANVVTRWFGEDYAQLDPLLQDLHRRGGILHGPAHISIARSGIGGWLGRRLAHKLGIPGDQPQQDFRVHIRHDAAGLHWRRRFGQGHSVSSLFEPVGVRHHGYWLEHTGFLKLQLTVDIIDGGWYWRPLRISAGGLKLPLWLFPQARAYKRIEDGQYCFGVEFTLPLLGKVLSYEGRLSVEVRPQA